MDVSKLKMCALADDDETRHSFRQRFPNHRILLGVSYGGTGDSDLQLESPCLFIKGPYRKKIRSGLRGRHMIGRQVARVGHVTAPCQDNTACLWPRLRQNDVI